MAERATYYCDPELHGGERTEATYYVVPIEKGFSDPSFACCPEHLEHAIGHVIDRKTSAGTSVRVMVVAGR